MRELDELSESVLQYDPKRILKHYEMSGTFYHDQESSLETEDRRLRPTDSQVSSNG